MRKIICTLALGALLCGSAWAADKTIKQRGCELSVPETWTVESKGGEANSPDKKLTAIVGQAGFFSVESFADAKKMAKGANEGNKVTKETATELELEGPSMFDKPHVYRVIPTGAKTFCVGEVMYSGAAALPEARKVARTLKAAK